jgi:RNA polymerase sigma-70 factor, ECF subfamily
MPAPAHEARLGDEFEAVYEREFAFVWRTLLHFGVPPAQAEDAAQDVFIVVHRRLASWDRAASVRAWLYGICRRVAADHRRAQGRHQRKLDALPCPPASPGLDAQIADRELLSLIEAALAELGPGPREAFVLTELEGLSAREIAELTGTNPNTVAARLRKARAWIADALAGRPRTRGQRHG